MGTSMGGMHSWLWGEMYPDFMDAAMPLASLPVEISGRNRFFRRMVIDPIRNDPDWKNGEYKTQPVRGLTTALYTLMMMTSSPLQMQKQMPTKAAADTAFDARIKQLLTSYDANDMLYQFDSSRYYNPEPKLETITTHLLAVNSADDQVNPPELGIMEKQIKRVKNGRFILLPITDETAWARHSHYCIDLAKISWRAFNGNTRKSNNKKAAYECSLFVKNSSSGVPFGIRVFSSSAYKCTVPNPPVRYRCRSPFPFYRRSIRR